MANPEMEGETGSLYEAIRQDLIRLHAHWQLFRQLFTTSNERMELFNNTAPGFFRFLQDMLVDDAVIALSRLTDPDKFNSIARLIKVSKNQIHHALHDELESDVANLTKKCEDIREHRDKRVAHRSRGGSPPSFDNGPVELPPITRQLIEGALEDSAELMNKFLGHFASTHQVFEPTVTGDADVLVHFLEKGYEVSRPPAEYR